MARGDEELQAAGGHGAIAPNGKPVESVWHFPRPPKLELVDWRVRVIHDGSVIVDAPSAWRVLETSQAPAYYVGSEFVDLDRLEHADRGSLCEWKGAARYWRLRGGRHAVAWSYPDPLPGYEPLRNHLAFFASRLAACYVGAERVRPGEAFRRVVRLREISHEPLQRRFEQVGAGVLDVAGELRPVQEGKPLAGQEMVRLHGREEHPALCDVEVVYSDAERDGGEQSGGGPPKVASDAYRRGWGQVFGKRSRNTDRSLN